VVGGCDRVFFIILMRVSSEAGPRGANPLTTSRILPLGVALVLALRPAAIALAGATGPPTVRRLAFAWGGVPADGERNTAALRAGASGRHHPFVSLRGGLDQPAGMVALLPGTLICTSTLEATQGSMVSLVSSHTNATRIGRHLWDIDSKFSPGLPPGWLPASRVCLRWCPSDEPSLA